MKLLASSVLLTTLSGCAFVSDDALDERRLEIDADGDGHYAGDAVWADDCDDDDPDAWAMVDRFTDADGDGVGSTAVTVCENATSVAASDGDCNDADPAIHPAAVESCNGVDDNCDGTIDEGDALWFADADGDGFGDRDDVGQACEGAGGLVQDATDCDDTAAGVNPDATETCNALDDDCDGTIDEDAPIWYADSDEDGFGNAEASVQTCDPGTGFVADATDCDDLSDAVKPGADEICNFTDDDCDGDVDEDALDATDWFEDLDGDLFGGTTVATACTAPPGFVDLGGDCNDVNDGVFPGALDICDSRDNDCDSEQDEDGPLWFADSDGDGYGFSGAATQNSCTDPGAGWADNIDDCNDSDGGVFPGAPERCDGTDEDCNGEADNDAIDPADWYLDADNDGFGDAGSVTAACTLPAGYTSDDADCDDEDATVFPDAQELCDGIDNNCDGGIDETAPTWFEDLDDDGYGTPADTTVGCVEPEGFASRDDDCDDARAESNPGATEVPYNGEDDDCDETTLDDDLDGDGVDLGDGDCDDERSDVHPGAELQCNTGLDESCGTADVSPCRIGGRNFTTSLGVTIADPAETTSVFGSPMVTGDLDGNGVLDLVIGESAVTGDRDGTAYLFLNWADQSSPPSRPSDADFELHSEETGDGVADGWDTLATGDLNGDGFDELLLGASQEEDGCLAGGCGTHHAGALYIVCGTEDIADAGDRNLSSTGMTKIIGAGDFRLGGDVLAGDLDDDGVDDLIVSAFRTGAQHGTAYIQYGDTNWDLGSGSGDICDLDGAAESAEYKIRGEGNADYLSQLDVGDVDGDGTDDLLLSSAGHISYAGKAFLFRNDAGRQSGEVNASSADTAFRGTANFTAFGSQNALCDVDGDGLADALIGEHGWPAPSNVTKSQGRVHVFLSPIDPLVRPDEGAAIYMGQEYSDALGFPACLGDIDGDGAQDHAVGSSTTQTDGRRGAVYLRYGFTPGTHELDPFADDALIGPTPAEPAYVSMPLGDLDGDGHDDIGITQTPFSGYAGAAHIVWGQGL